MDNFKELSRYFPGLMLWKKDINSVYLEMNDLLAKSLGFKNPQAAQGLTDYEIPCPVAECAEAYRQQDKQVIVSGRRLKALEIVTDASNKRVIFLTNKGPCYQGGKLIGTTGYTVDITPVFAKLGATLPIIPEFSNNLTQASLVIGLEQACGVDISQIEAIFLFYLVRGCSLDEIAKLMHSNITTTNKHLEHLLQNFNCSNELELIALAKENGFLSNIPEYLFDNIFSSKELDDTIEKPETKLEITEE